MNRRHFLGSAALGAAFGLSSAASAKIVPVDLKSRNFEPLKLPRPISLAALTVLDVSPANQVLCADKAGYSHVGIRLVPATPEETQWSMIGDTPMIREVEANLKATGVRVLDIEILRIKPDTRAVNWKAFFETGARLGAANVLCAGNDPDLDRLTDNFAELCEIAHPFGLSLSIEPMPWCDVSTVKGAGEIMKRVNRPNSGHGRDPLPGPQLPPFARYGRRGPHGSSEAPSGSPDFDRSLQRRPRAHDESARSRSHVPRRHGGRVERRGRTLTSFFTGLGERTAPSSPSIHPGTKP